MSKTVPRHDPAAVRAWAGRTGYLSPGQDRAPERSPRLARQIAAREAGLAQLRHDGAAGYRELAAARLAVAVLQAAWAGLDGDDILAVVVTGSLPDNGGPPRLLTDPDWPVTP